MKESLSPQDEALRKLTEEKEFLTGFENEERRRVLIEKRKELIDQLENSNRDGYLSTRYHHSSDYMEQANNEVIQLEKEIHALEGAEREYRKGEEIQKRKYRIKEIDKANGAGNLAAEYNHAPDYMAKADAEVVQLEKEIHELENPGSTMKVKEQPEEVKPEEEEKPPEEKPKKEKKPRKPRVKKPKVEVEEPKPEESVEGEKKEEEKPEVPKEEPKEEKKEKGKETLAEMIAKAQEKDRKLKEEKQKKRQLGAVQTDLMEKRAREVGTERMNRNTAEIGSSWNPVNLVKKVWHNMTGEYKRVKEIQRVREEMRTAGSTQGIEDADGTVDSRIKGAILERFLKDTPGLVHEAAGEHKLEGLAPERRATAEAAIRAAIIAYASDANPNRAISEGNLTEAINRAYADVFADPEGNRSFEPLNIADNIKEYAREMRGQVEHGIAVENLDLDFEMTFGKATTGARTEEVHTWLEDKIQRMARNKTGRFINETSVAAAVCVATALVTKSSQWAFRTVAGVFGGGLVLGGALAAKREGAQNETDRASHARSMAAGRMFNAENSPRRREMNETTYQMTPVGRTIENLARIRQEIEASNHPGEAETGVRSLIGILGEIDTRIALSDRDNIDLLAYSNPEDIEVERTQLDIARAEAKVFARQVYEGLGLSASTRDFDHHLASTASAYSESITEEISAKNETFEALKKRRRNAAFVKGAATAGVAGWIFREVIHLGDSGYEKLTADPLTPSESVSVKGAPDTFQAMDTHGVHHEITNIKSGSLKLPEGFHIVDNGNPDEYTIVKGGHFDVNGDIVGGKVVAENIAFDKAGGSYELTQPSVDTLNKAGFSFLKHPESNTAISDFTIEETKNLTPQEYAAAHPEEFTRSHRQGWADNNTAKFDKNELRLNDPVIGKDGQIQISMRGMTHHGSVMGNKHFDVPRLVKGGQMEIWVSASEDSQFTPARISVGPDGIARIDPNSTVGKLFKFDAQGHIIDRPRFTEAAAITGEQDGIKSAVICATDEGPRGGHTISEKVTVQGVREVTTSNTGTELVYEGPQEPDTLNPFVPIPYFIPRTPMERLKQREQGLVVPPYYYGYGESHEMNEWKKDFSPRLQGNPEANLDPKEEVKWYFEAQEKRYPGYMEKELKDLEGQNKEPMGKNVEGVVCLAAAGHQEHENIYRTLETYRVQQNKKGESIWKGKDSQFEIYLYVNWPKGKDPKKTIDEINRFKEAHPEVPVNVYTEEINNGKVEVGWYKKKAFDLALKKHSENGTDKDLILIANDADMTYSNPNYLESALGEINSEEGKKCDAILGRFDLDPSVYEKYPTFHAAMRFWQFMEATMRNKHGIIGTQGRNTIMKGSSYAAVGGNRTKDFWADIEFGQLFVQARKKNTVAYSNKDWVMVDPRREIDKFKSGDKLAGTWNDFNSREVRGNKSSHNIPENLDTKTLSSVPENDPVVVQFRERLQDEIQGIADMFLRISPDYGNSKAVHEKQIADAQKVVKRAAGLIGLKTDIKRDGDKIIIKITNTKKLREDLRDYETENKKETKLNFGGKKNPLF